MTPDEETLRHFKTVLWPQAYRTQDAELLGRLVTPALFAAFQQLIATAIDLWEPRFRVRKITPSGTVDEIRLGKVGFLFEVDYRPRGHLGDFTVERVVNFGLSFRAGGVEVNP